MEQRHWKKAGITTSLLGYGCMRLPTLPDGRIGHGADDLNLALEATVSPAHHLLGLVNGGPKPC